MQPSWLSRIDVVLRLTELRVRDLGHKALECSGLDSACSFNVMLMSLQPPIQLSSKPGEGGFSSHA